jgi:hypothetical protein
MTSVDGELADRHTLPRGPEPATVPVEGPEPVQTVEQSPLIDELVEGLEDLGIQVALIDEPVIAPEPAVTPATPAETPRRPSPRIVLDLSPGEGEDDSLPSTRPVTPDEPGELQPGAPESALQEEGAWEGDRGDLQEPDPFTLQARIGRDPFTLQARIGRLEGRLDRLPEETTSYVERRLRQTGDAVMVEARAEAVRVGREAVARVEAERGLRKGPQLGDLNNQLKEERKAREKLGRGLDQQRREMKGLGEDNQRLRNELQGLRGEAAGERQEVQDEELEDLRVEMDQLHEQVAGLRRWMVDMAMARPGPAPRDRGLEERAVPRRRPLEGACDWPSENVWNPEEEGPDSDQTPARRGRDGAGGKARGRRR